MSVVTRIRTSEELTVPFTPEQVWTVLVDVAGYPSWWPANLAVNILYEPGVLIGTEFEVKPFLGRAYCCRFEEVEEPFHMRIRYFGGTLEGPGGFHLEPVGGSTHIRYEMDVFARGLDVAMLSQVVPLQKVHAARLKSVLRSLATRLSSEVEPSSTAAETSVEIVAGRAGEEAVVTRGAAEEEKGVETAAREAALPSTEGNAAGIAGKETADRPAPIERPTHPAPLHAQRTEAGAISASNFDRARDYLEALSSAAPPEFIAAFFAETAILEEWPHQFLPHAVSRNRHDIGASRARDLSLLRIQRFELRGATGGGTQVALEVWWKASLAQARDGLEAGGELAARMAIFLKFDGGKIVRQRTYACFEPSADRDRREPARPAGARPAEAFAASPGEGKAPSRPAGSHFEVARTYLDALSSRATAHTISGYFADDAVLEEFPNRFRPDGAWRHLDDIKRARTEELARLSEENYELRGATGGGSQVAMEIHWTAVVAKASLGGPAPGQRLEGRIAVFLKFRDGLIVRQRNYLCA